MKISCLTFLLIPFLLFQNTVASAFVLTDRAEISILTCSAGDEAYSVYGHSAIRVKDASYDYDVVFNYGIFDFNTPNFMYRFVSGQTDYLLGAYKFSVFFDDYVASQRSIFEQVLNLTQSEKQKVFDFLLWNAKPENRVYRYNFLFDNCATRIRDVVMEQSDGEVLFPENTGNRKTYRQLIKEYHSKLLWMNFGVDLIVGAPADKRAPLFDEMFLPDYLMGHFANSKIKTGSATRPLVKSSRVIYQAPGLKFPGSGLTSPFLVFGLLLAVVVYISVRQFREKKISYRADYIVFGINGLMGIIMLWLALYSEHPAMHPNYNLVWAIPLNFVFVFVWKIKKWRPVTRYYFVLVSGWLLLFFLFGIFLPQEFHVVFYLLAFIVFARSVLHSILIFRGRRFPSSPKLS
jgi:hypothetical protein